MKIHVLPGDALAEDFKKNGIEGEIVVCRECLIDGEIKARILEDFWRVESRIYQSCLRRTDEEEYFQGVVGEFEKLKNLAPETEVNLWFEYELFCQVNMWFCLYLLDETQCKNLPRRAGCQKRKRHLERFRQIGHGRFGKMFRGKNKIWRKRYFARQRVFGKHFKIKISINLNSFERNKIRMFSALKRSLPKRKLKNNSRPKNTLQKIISTGETDFGEIFETFAKTEGVYGFGDAQVKRILQEI